jgi:sugar lactone lactonase YvrE
MPELALDAKAELGEGPIWDIDRRQLVFVDIMRGHVHAFDPVRGTDRLYEVDRPVGAIACATRGDWVLAAGQGFVRLNPDTGRVTPLADAAPGRTDIRMNDGYVDARGRFWAGTLSLRREPEQGALYRLDPDGSVHTMIRQVTTSNGIDWSLDGRLMYYIDTRTRRVDLFDFDADAGRISNRRLFLEVPAADGSPDGLIVDGAGGIWVAFWRGGAVRRYTPDGQLDRSVALPATLVTKCAFGGPDLTDLYITTASNDLTPAEREAQPLAGGLFRIRPGVAGRAPHRFAG